MNKTLNESMKSISQSRIALLAAVMTPLSLVSTACMDVADGEAVAEVADLKISEPADRSDKKANADLLGDCSVHGDGRLYCGNVYDAPIYHGPNYAHGAIDFMRTTYSWFDCWAYGVEHEGRNFTWYHTVGDVYGHKGYMPAGFVFTSPKFDDHPDWYGLRHCDE